MIRVETINESVTGNKPAQVLVYEDERLVVEVVATIKQRKGADGGMYSVVELEEKSVS